MYYEIRVLEASELAMFCELIDVFADVFEMQNFTKPSADHLHAMLHDPKFFVVVASAEQRVIAGLTVYILEQYYSPRPLAYVYDLAVERQYQRQGIGRALMQFTNDYCAAKGFEELFVQADSVDDHAVEFYRRTNASHEEQNNQFSYFFK